MPRTITGMGTIFIDGYELLRLVDSVVSDELPVDKTWASGLRYSKRLIRQQMGLEQEDSKHGQTQTETT